MVKYTTSWRWLACFFCIVALGVTLDLATKDMISGKLPADQRHYVAIQERVIIPKWFSLLTNSPVNQGALFSLGNKLGMTANTFFIVVSCLAIMGILIWAFWPNIKKPVLYMVTLGFILSGAIGNAYDRFAYGGVRDWIWVYYKRGENDYPFNWPVFNLADCFLIGGASLLILHGLLWPTHSQEKSPAASTEPAKS